MLKNKQVLRRPIFSIGQYVRAVHWEQLIFIHTFIFTNISTSILGAVSQILGKVKGFSRSIELSELVNIFQCSIKRFFVFS